MEPYTHPDEITSLGFQSIYPDQFHPLSQIINWFLRKLKSNIRAYVILEEDSAIGWCIGHRLKAVELSRRLTLNQQGNYFDPYQRRFVTQLYYRLGLLTR